MVQNDRSTACTAPKEVNMSSVCENSQQYYGENTSNETEQSLHC